MYNRSISKLLIDGLYRSHDYKKYDVVLLVCLGIGATPLICIVKDVLNNIKQQKDISDGLVESGHKGSKRKEGDALSALITLCFINLQAKSGINIVSGTRVKTHVTVNHPVDHRIG
ncbi:hypothetical protein H5410_055760 [Solanum commersonii]|uniref:Ferric reductase NAD binding domain-containing protein n=1 Tax=Solanum commersonii TaxID=4109 RepID=A0A9J5WJ99_SOLCO|nr:hypothetical protein H5410_055760 [Solanum commersonii]